MKNGCQAIEKKESQSGKLDESKSKKAFNPLSNIPAPKKKTPYKIFDDLVLILIILSSIILAVDNPLNDPNSSFMKLIGFIDISFTCVFFIEALIKIIAKGFFYNNMGPIKPYLSNVWNMLDAFVVFASLLDLAFMISGVDMQSMKALKALRALRALRPLRVISKNEGMRLVVNALLASIPSMTNVLLVCALITLIFAIMGVNFFKGAFFSCNQAPNGDKIDLSKIDTKQDCLDQGGEWISADWNFDNTLTAMLTLF